MVSTDWYLIIVSAEQEVCAINYVNSIFQQQCSCYYTLVLKMENYIFTLHQLFRLDGNYLPYHRWCSRVCLCPSSIFSSLNILGNLNKSRRLVYVGSSNTRLHSQYSWYFVWTTFQLHSVTILITKGIKSCENYPPHMYLGSMGLGRIQTWGR
jgi:hypothetical protein